MARPVDEESTRLEAARGAGTVRTAPGPIHPADEAEDAARRAVEGIGIGGPPGDHDGTDGT